MNVKEEQVFEEQVRFIFFLVEPPFAKLFSPLQMQDEASPVPLSENALRTFGSQAPTTATPAGVRSVTSQQGSTR